MPTSRVEAFSDGVFAIAITLLVLDVHVPDSASGRLGHDLAHQWPSYAAYAVSFLIIGIIWVNHHGMFALIRCVDRGLLFLNLGLLATVSFLPFPTSLLAEYVRDGSNAHLAAAVYGANMTAIGLSFLAMWWRLSRHPELSTPETTPAALQGALRRTLPGPIVYGATIGLAFVSPIACLAVYAAIAVYFSVSFVTIGDGARPSA